MGCSLTRLRFGNPKPCAVPPLATATLFFSNCLFVGPASLSSRLFAHLIVFSLQIVVGQMSFSFIQLRKFLFQQNEINQKKQFDVCSQQVSEPLAVVLFSVPSGIFYQQLLYIIVSCTYHCTYCEVLMMATSTYFCIFVPPF